MTDYTDNELILLAMDAEDDYQPMPPKSSRLVTLHIMRQQDKEKPE